MIFFFIRLENKTQLITTNKFILNYKFSLHLCQLVKLKFYKLLILKNFYSYIVFNQLSYNLKINFTQFKKNKISSLFRSTGTFLKTINLLQKYLRRTLKGVRLFYNIFLKSFLKTVVNSFFIIKVKGLKKGNWICEALRTVKAFKVISLLTLNNKIYSNFKIKKSIKKRIKKKIVTKENFIW